MLAVLLNNSLARDFFQTPYGSALHMAALFGSKTTMDFLLRQSNCPPINAVDSHGNTALHLASRNGRFRVVQLLVQKGADDSITNHDGKDARDVGKSDEIKQFFDGNHLTVIIIINLFVLDRRRTFVMEKTLEMHRLASQGSLPGLQDLFSHPRTAKLLNVNEVDPMSGETILHKAAESDDFELVTWCLKMKADPLVRDKRGKLAQEKAKADKVKQLLKEGTQK